MMWCVVVMAVARRLIHEPVVAQAYPRPAPDRRLVPEAGQAVAPILDNIHLAIAHLPDGVLRQQAEC